MGRFVEGACREQTTLFPDQLDDYMTQENEVRVGATRVSMVPLHLNAEIFGSLLEAQVVIEQWRKRYNAERPHSTQRYITPDMAYFR